VSLPLAALGPWPNQRVEAVLFAGIPYVRWLAAWTRELAWQSVTGPSKSTGIRLDLDLLSTSHENAVCYKQAHHSGWLCRYGRPAGMKREERAERSALRRLPCDGRLESLGCLHVV